MTADDFRRIALGMDGAVEGAHMGHPDFRANGRIFATLAPDHVRGMVKLTPELQQQLMRASRAFEPASGAWGRQGSTMVTLSAIDEETLGEAMTLAWRAAMESPAPRSRSSKRSAGAKRATGAKPSSGGTPPSARKRSRTGQAGGSRANRRSSKR